MKKSPAILLSLLLTSPVLADSFPHKTAIYELTTSGPMVNIVTENYVSFSENMLESVSAEWSTQKTPMQVTHTFNLNKGSDIFALDLDTKRCTKTNIKAVTDMVHNPRQFAEAMKKQMGLKKAGTCEGANLKGIKYTSSFGEICFYKDVFMLWQKGMGTTTTVTKVKFDEPLPKHKIQLPDGVKCVAGPDLSKGLGNIGSFGNTSDQSNVGNQQQNPANMEEAMKKAQEMMQQFGDMMKQQ